MSTNAHVKSLLRDISRLRKDVSSIERLSFEVASDRLTTLIRSTLYPSKMQDSDKSAASNSGKEDGSR
jgi:hypothetical protein